MKTIDLRRDTITLPDQTMSTEAFKAPLGDSVYGEDPKQEELEAYAVELLGMDGSLFVPSGTMGNLVALLSHTSRGDEIIMEENAHIGTSETGGAACVGGLLTTLWRAGFAPFSLIFAITYGLLVDSFFHLLKVRVPNGGVRTSRVITSLMLSSAVIGLLTTYVMVTIGLMPMMPTLYLIIIIVGIVNGTVAGYLTSLIWNRYLKDLKKLRFPCQRPHRMKIFSLILKRN